MSTGRIVEGRGGLYTALDEYGREHVLRAKKKFRRQNISPLVGDYIAFTPGQGEEHGWVEDILPRTSLCTRPQAANITLLVLVVAPVPAPDWLLVDKLLLGACMQGMKAVVAANKCDISGDVARQAAHDYKRADVPALAVSAVSGLGLDALKGVMRGETACFAGQSGVGKSTLINALLGMTLQTGDISRIARGRHTTRYARLIQREGVTVLDTPGFSLLESDTPLDPALLPENYPEFAPYSGACRFQPCYHDTEPGCAVRQAVDAGDISRARHDRYRELLSSARQAWKERYD